jgi:hypothetical protein
MSDNGPVTQEECRERNKGSMDWGHDTADSLTQELKDLAATTSRLSANTDRLTWVISDPDVGLVMQVRQLAGIVSTVKDTQFAQGVRLSAYDVTAARAIEAKKPWQIMFLSLLEKVIWSILAGAVAWLWATRV